MYYLDGGLKMRIMRHRHDSFAASSDAQALAIGTVLIITIVVTATTVYLAINAPVETKKCEFLHSTEVTDDFVTLHSSINLLHSNINSLILNKYPAENPEIRQRRSSISSFVRRNSLITSVPIKKMPTKESIIALPLASGTISFSPDEGNITLQLSEKGTGSASHSWRTNNFVECPAPECNFSKVCEAGCCGDVDNSSGNLTLSGPPYVSACIVSNMTNISGTIGFDTGSNSTVYKNKNITWYAENITADTDIILKVRTDMFPDMRNATDWHECYEIKSSEIKLEDGIRNFSLSDLFSVSNGHRYVQFRAELKTENPQKTPALVNVSIDYSHENVTTLAQSSGSITFSTGYHYLPNQVLTYENGAVIKNQTKGELVHNHAPFNFSFFNDSGVTKINMSLVDLTLTGANVSGRAGEATLVRLLLVDRKLISNSLFYPNLTINVTSEHYQAIEKWFNNTLKEANLTASQDYNLTPGNATTKTVSVEFYAKEYGIELYLEEAEIGVKI